MTGGVIVAFLLSFVAGPGLCALLLRLPPDRGLMTALLVLTVVLAAGAVALQGRAPLAGVLAGWLGWVLACTIIAQALRRRAAPRPSPRAVTITAILATTMPWFGLATARFMH
ncbi:hypothetical protein [Sagittula salina]|uniref:Uncharacterized protein n=1 Tax=Sagittula salina TaxID=2820268 RepID=A0A940S1P2_9RHOB|nr:hypothetical protein [Sagittula salina]MBP0484368.1 hypothetical protein [Sagittula salina]